MRKQLLILLLLSHALAARAADEAAAPQQANGAASAAMIEAAAAQNMAREDALQVKNLSGVVLAISATDLQAQPAQAQEEELKSSVLKLTASPKLRSAIGLIYDEREQRPLYSKSADAVTPIASITKLMTAMVLLDAQLPMDEEISISAQDADRHKITRSRMHPGVTATRGELLKLALMASENRAAAALARTYPGGTQAALAQMNAKAHELGMTSTRFLDPTGLNSGNVSTAQDLVKMVRAAQGYELIHKYTTSTSHTLEQVGHRPMQFRNTNPLVRNTSWEIGLSKTGYISEAGRCLVMEATISQHPVIIVLLDSWGKHTRVGDANRVKQWMENGYRRANY